MTCTPPQAPPAPAARTHRRGNTLITLPPAGYLDDLHTFDPATMAWNPLSAADSARRPSARYGHGFASAGGRLYVHGGSGPSSPVSGTRVAGMLPAASALEGTTLKATGDSGRSTDSSVMTNATGSTDGWSRKTTTAAAIMGKRPTATSVRLPTTMATGTAEVPGTGTRSSWQESSDIICAETH